MEVIKATTNNKEVNNLMNAFRSLPLSLFKEYLKRRKISFSYPDTARLIKAHNFRKEGKFLYAKKKFSQSRKQIIFKKNIICLILDIADRYSKSDLEIEYHTFRLKDKSLFYEIILKTDKEQTSYIALWQQQLTIENKNILTYINSIPNKILLIQRKQIRKFIPFVLENSRTIYFDLKGNRRIFKKCQTTKK